MKAVVAAFNQEKALVGAFSVITNLRMELFGALVFIHCPDNGAELPAVGDRELCRVLQDRGPDRSQGDRRGGGGGNHGRRAEDGRDHPLHQVASTLLHSQTTSSLYCQNEGTWKIN